MFGAWSKSFSKFPLLLEECFDGLYEPFGALYEAFYDWPCLVLQPHLLGSIEGARAWSF